MIAKLWGCVVARLDVAFGGDAVLLTMARFHFAIVPVVLMRAAYNAPPSLRHTVFGVDLYCLTYEHFVIKHFGVVFVVPLRQPNCPLTCLIHRGRTYCLMFDRICPM